MNMRTSESNGGAATLRRRARVAERAWCRENVKARRVLDADRHREARHRRADLLDHCRGGVWAFERICYEAHGDDLMPVDVWWADEVV